MKWSVDNLAPKAVSISASRRTDIPALYGKWFKRRLREGYAEYVPMGPPRRVRRSLRPEDVTHFNFWTKWPRPFLPVLEDVLKAGFPVLWNVTITGLGGTEVEPHVPATDKAVASTIELAQMVSPAAVLWRYDPVFLSARYSPAYHRTTFARVVEGLVDHVDRVAISFVTRYKRQVDPDLQAYQRESGDAVERPARSQEVELASALRDIARSAGLALTVCCSPELRQTLDCPRSDCNSFDWARRAYPQLERHRRLRDKPCRADCGCSEEFDIGVYDTCILGCRYSYGSCSERVARRHFRQHDPNAACLIP